MASSNTSVSSPRAGSRRYRWLAFGVGSAYLVLLFAPLWGYDASTILSLDSLALAILTILMFLVRLRAPLEGFRSFDEIARPSSDLPTA